MTHTSTSPNYQILASLDLGRRQVELEGYELVNKQVETALALREPVGRWVQQSASLLQRPGGSRRRNAQPVPLPRPPRPRQPVLLRTLRLRPLTGPDPGG